MFENMSTGLFILIIIAVFLFIGSRSKRRGGGRSGRYDSSSDWGDFGGDGGGGD